jgi:hypothetical protein
MAEQMARMTADEVLTRTAGGELLTFVDARAEEAWTSSPNKLPGAVRVAPAEPERYLVEIPHDRPVVTYCT